MLRKFATALVMGAALTLGVAGCYGPSKAPQVVPVVEEEVVIEEEPDEEQEATAGGISNQEACMLISEKALDAAEAIDEPGDSAAFIEAQETFTEALREAAEAAADPEFKAAALEAYELSLINDEFYRRLNVEMDPTIDFDEAMEASSNFSDAYLNLLDLCSK